MLASQCEKSSDSFVSCRFPSRVFRQGKVDLVEATLYSVDSMAKTYRIPFLYNSTLCQYGR